MRNEDPQHELPNGWTEISLNKAVEIRDRERIPVNAKERQRRVEGKDAANLYPYYGATGQVDWIDEYLFENELVLLGEDGAPFFDPYKNTAYLIDGKTWVNNHAHVLEARPGVTTNRFVLYYLNSFDYHGYVTGTTRLKLTQGQLKRILITLPPLPEQRRIVEKIEELFSDLDAGEQALTDVRHRLRRYRQSVLKAAVEGTLTEAWRLHHGHEAEPAEALLERILAERRTRWEAEQLAKYEAKGKTPPKGWQQRYKEPATPDTDVLPTLPDGWVWANIDAITVRGPQNGLYLPKSKYGSGTAILRIDDYQSDWSRSVSEMQKVNAEPKDVEKYGLQVGDLVINRVNSPSHLGKSLVVEDRHVPALFESNMMRLQLASHVSPSWLDMYLQSTVGKTRLVQNAKWAVNQASINQQDVAQTAVLLPPLTEQQRIVEEVERLLSVADAAEQTVERELQRAERLRQGILKRAFAGQLVPQDKSDEPADVLLERIRSTNGKPPRRTSAPTEEAGQFRLDL